MFANEQAERMENVETKEEEKLVRAGAKALGVVFIYVLLSFIYYSIAHRYALIYFYESTANISQDIITPYALLALVVGIITLVVAEPLFEKDAGITGGIASLIAGIALTAFLVTIGIVSITASDMQSRITVDPSMFQSNQTIKMYGQVINTSEDNNFFPVQLLVYENYKQQGEDVSSNYTSQVQTFNSYDPRYTVKYQVLYITTVKPNLLSSIDTSDSLKYYTSDKLSFYETELLTGSLVQNAEKHYTETQFPEGQTCCYEQYLHKLANQDPLMEAYTKQFVPLFNSVNVFKVKGKNIIYAVVPLRIKNFAIYYQNFKFTYDNNDADKVKNMIYNTLKPYIIKQGK